MLAFMEKPSRKLYPSYYQVIAEPIDMLTIEANIKDEKYQNENELVQDFKVNRRKKCKNQKLRNLKCLYRIVEFIFFFFVFS